jgi:hypothetical protein
MDDLITLGVKVQTTGGAQAAQGLGAFQKAAQGAAGAADQLENKVNALGAAQSKSAAPARSMAGAMNGLGSAFKNNSGAIQNTSFQLQDILVQMEMGVPITRTLGQQLPQLLGGFGPLGAVIGVAVGALLSFAPALFSSSDGAADLKTATEGLADAMSALGSATKGANQDFVDLRAEYGANAAAAERFLELQRQVAQLQARQSFGAAASAVAAFAAGDLGGDTAAQLKERAVQYDQFSAALKNTQTEIAGIEGLTRDLTTAEQDNLDALYIKQGMYQDALFTLSDYKRRVEELGLALGATEGEGGKLAVAFAELAEARTFDEQALAAQRLSDVILAATEGLTTASAEGIALSDAIVKTVIDGLRLEQLSFGEDAAAVVADETETAADNLATASSNAGALADEISRARTRADELSGSLAAVAALAAQSVTTRIEAEIKLKYAGDPVGAAGAIAASQFDRSGAGPLLNAPTGVSDVVRGYRDAIIANAEAAAEAQLALADFNKEVKGGASGAKAAASDVKRYYDATRTDAEKYAAGLAEISALHASGAMDADLYARSVEELTLKFDPLGQLISGLADTVENELNSAFASVINGTATLGDALLTFASNVLAKVAQELFAQQFAAPIAAGIKSFIGSEDGNIFGPSGFVPFAKGGVVSGPTIFPFANGTGLMGEAGPEAIMPLSRGSDGKLGVAAANGNSAPKITINNYSGQEASASTDNMGNMIIEIGRAIAQDITGGGPTYRAIKSTFGISNRLQQRG